VVPDPLDSLAGLAGPGDAGAAPERPGGRL